MIFWILVALVIAATVATYIHFSDDSIGFAFVGALLSAATAGFVGFLIFAACGTWIPWNNDKVADNTYKLKAIGNSNALEGRLFFLGGGYVNDKRVLNFISQRDGGAIRVEQAEAEESTIYEGSKDATVRIKHFEHNNGWVSPWPLGSHDEYEFRIPTGSVVESYTLDNK
jgi:hypothetical protein